MNTASVVYNIYMKHRYRWPRILSIVFTAGISLFALDSFSLPDWPVALAIHLIPTLILIGATVYAWKHPRSGGVLFVFLGVAGLLFLRAPVVAFPAVFIGGWFLFEAIKSSGKN